MPIPPIIGQALISSVGGLIGTGLQSSQANRNVKRTIQANKELANLRYKNDMEMAEYSFDKNLEMWNLQNKYNSPAAQMQRFEDAGLNKHMIYGQGTPGNATGMPSFTGPGYYPPDIDYSGMQSIAGNTLSAFTGATKNVLEIAQQKERLDQLSVQTWLAETTATDQADLKANMADKSFWDKNAAKFASEIAKIHRQMWEDRISPTDAAYIRLIQDGLNKLDQAPEWLKQMLNRTGKHLESFGRGVNNIYNAFDSLNEFIRSVLPGWMNFENLNLK